MQYTKVLGLVINYKKNKMKELQLKKFTETISKFGLTKEEGKAFEDVMNRVGVEASKAGEALRKLMLGLKKIKHIKPKYKAWQQPYKYHR
jgi:hypothetical protein